MCFLFWHFNPSITIASQLQTGSRENEGMAFISGTLLAAFMLNAEVS